MDLAGLIVIEKWIFMHVLIFVADSVKISSTQPKTIWRA